MGSGRDGDDGRRASLGRAGARGLGTALLAAVAVFVSAGGPADRSAAADGAGVAEAATAEAPAPADLTAAFRRAASVRPLTSLLVARDGEMLGEAYWDGGAPDEPVNVKSTSKSLLSALVGIAVAEGHLEGPGQRLAELLPEDFSRLDDPRKREITLGHLLSMQAGLRTTSFSSYGAWVSSGDWIRWALERPLECPPGRCWEYSTGNYHLLSAALTEATGVDTRTYAGRELLSPLGIPARPWDRGPRGYYLGGNNMALTPREMLRFGQLYLRGGRWDGEQVVPESWVEASLTPRVVSSWNGHDYGYGWWSRRLAGERVWFAWGYGGQYVFLVPDLDLAVVTTTDPGLERGRRDADRAIFDLLRDEILPEVQRTSTIAAAEESGDDPRTGAPDAAGGP